MAKTNYKKLNLLSPVITKQQFTDREYCGEFYKYLTVPGYVNKDILKKDISKGAKQYKELLSLIERKENNYKKKLVSAKTTGDFSKDIGRFFLIEAGSQEDGLAAVTYLSAALREIKRKDNTSFIKESRQRILSKENLTLDYDQDFIDELFANHTAKKNKQDDLTQEIEIPFRFEDEKDNKKKSHKYNDKDNYLDDCLEDYEEDCKEDCKEDYDEFYDEDEWYENPNNIEILDLSDVVAGVNINDSPFPFENVTMSGGLSPNRKKPHWMEYSTEQICIVTDGETNHFFGAKSNPYIFDHFKNHEFVFIVDVKGQEQDLYSDIDDFDYDEERDDHVIEEDFAEEETIDSWSYTIMLNYTADKISVNMSSLERKEFNRILFENWLAKMELKKDKKLNVDKILSTANKIQIEGISATLEKIFTYVKHTDPDCTTVKNEHFKNLGLLIANDNKENTATNENDLVGMEDVKAQIERIVQILKYNKERKAMGIPGAAYRNVFLMIGAPGTAKTTMARLLGKRLQKEKLLKGNRFASYTGAELKAEYVGQTAPKVHRIFAENDIIFIDEAYSVCAGSHGEQDIFSQEALAQLAVELENHGTDRLILFAGYGGKDIDSKNNLMKNFLDANPGIKSRINDTIFFPSYNEKDMLAICKGIAKNMGLKFSDDNDEVIMNYFKTRIHDDNFGNGREARSFIENCQKMLASRIMQLPENKRNKKNMTTIMKEDVLETVKEMTKATANQFGRNRNFTLGF